MARKSKSDLAAIKAKKQKKMAVGLGVLLLAVCAFSVPKTMKMMNQSAAVAAPPPAPAPAVPVPSAADAGAAELAAIDMPALPESAAPQAGAGQLVSFERFTSKDPFVQQLNPADAAGGGAPPSGDAPTEQPGIVDDLLDGDEGDAGGDGEPPDSTEAGGTFPPVSGGTGEDSGSTGDGDSTAPPPVAPSAATGAEISVNGADPERVSLDAAFPSTEPIFELVEVLATGVRIAVVDGNYETGAETITLTVGKPVTLMNTADGTRYEILVVRLV